jgi:hypothetical protein
MGGHIHMSMPGYDGDSIGDDEEEKVVDMDEVEQRRPHRHHADGGAEQEPEEESEDGQWQAEGGDGSTVGDLDEPQVRMEGMPSLDEEAELLRRLDAAAAAAAAVMADGDFLPPGHVLGQPMDDRELAALLERLGM